MDDEKRLKFVYEEAYNFLKNKVGESALKKELNYYLKKNKELPKPLNEVFKQMAGSLKNRERLNKQINEEDDENKIKVILLNFDQKKVRDKFGDNRNKEDWKRLFDEFKDELGEDRVGNNKNNRSFWVMYSKGILSCANFLSEFESKERFHEFVKSHLQDEFHIVRLPTKIKENVFGFGFPLACDFLKEIGYLEYGKPDIHLKNIFYGLDMTASDSDYEVFKKIREIAQIVGEKPAIVDKVFWLIGSGDFIYSIGKRIGRQKKEFIKQTRERLKASGLFGD